MGAGFGAVGTAADATDGGGLTESGSQLPPGLSDGPSTTWVPGGQFGIASARPPHKSSNTAVTEAAAIRIRPSYRAAHTTVLRAPIANPIALTSRCTSDTAANAVANCRSEMRQIGKSTSEMPNTKSP